MADLTPTAADLRARILAGLSSPPVEEATLDRAVRQLAIAECLDAAVDRDGEMIPGSTGQLRLNPAIAEAPAAAESASRLLHRLGVAAPNPSSSTVRHNAA
jgi:hypothetical protein